jgi:hypothetical protein
MPALAGLLTAASLAVLTSGSPLKASDHKVTVVELFTSQGCSSCPPADKLLGELVKRKDVVALTFPVDYWDYLGWKDTLASPSNSLRQRIYAKQRGDRQVYTPQMVINGAAHVIGSRRFDVDGAIRRHADDPRQMPVKVALKVTKSTIAVSTEPVKDGVSQKPAVLWLILFKKQVKVPIRRGENSGRTITYYNVVRQMTPIGQWDGKALKVTLPKAELMQGGYDGCAALLQVKGGGPILGVAYMDDWKM